MQVENEKYKGNIRFQLSVTIDSLSKRRVHNTGLLPQYYVENSHPAILAREIWEIAHLEMERQRKFCKDHGGVIYHYDYELLPLTGRLICKECGSTFKMKTSNSISQKGQRYYTCKKHRTGYKKAVKPDNCCNGTRLFIDEVHQAFVVAWNYLVDHPDEILVDHSEEILVDHHKQTVISKQTIKASEQSFEDEEQSNKVSEHSFEGEEQSNEVSEQSFDGEELLKAYRTRELKQLLPIGKISEINPEIVRRTLDHIIVKDDGTISVVFLSGTEVEV